MSEIDTEEEERDEGDEPEGEPEPEPEPAPRQRNLGGRPTKKETAAKKKAGAGYRAPDKYRVAWQSPSNQFHQRWAELCEILTSGPAEDRAALYAQPGEGPADIEIAVERVEPPGGGSMPRIPGSAIYKPKQSAADLAYYYLVNNYHRHFRGGGAQYACTFYWRRTNKTYVTRATIELESYDAIYEIMMSQQAAGAVAPTLGTQRPPLPVAAVGAGSAFGGGGYGGSNPADERLWRMLEARDAEIRELWKQRFPNEPLPPQLVAAGVGVAPPTSAPAAATPLAFDANAIAEATTKSVMGILAEIGIIDRVRAPISAPTSAGPPGAQATTHSPGATPGLAAGFVAAGSGVSPRLTRLRQEMDEMREEFAIRAEMRDLRDEFADEPEEEKKPDVGAGTSTEVAVKVPYKLVEIPGPKLWGKPIYHMKENEPSSSFVETLMRWSVRAPGVAEAVGAGVGKFVEGVGGAAIAKVTTSIAGFVDRMAVPAGAVGTGAGVEQKAEVVDTIPRSAQQAGSESEPPAPKNGAGAWKQVG